MQALATVLFENAGRTAEVTSADYFVSWMRNKFGNCAFSVISLKVWNSPPES